MLLAIDLKQVLGAPVALISQSKSFYRSWCMRYDAGDHWVVTVSQNQAITGYSLQEVTKNPLDFGQICVNICVIVLDIINKEEFWPIIEDLRKLCEECAVVFVSLNYKVAPSPDVVGAR